MGAVDISRPPGGNGPLARAFRRFASNGAALAGIAILVPMLVLIVAYPLILGHKPNDIDLLALNKAPSAAHWLGTDGVGRDILARVLQGGRISLLVAVVSVAISLAIGFLVGSISAMAGRFTDAAIMRLVDLAMTLPPVISLLVLASITGAGIVPTIIVISLLSWPVLARMVRARLMELRERDFVVASRGMGAGLGHLLWRHGLPNSIDILVVTATLQIAAAILLEAGLSFLGLGDPNQMSWGLMIGSSRQYVLSCWWAVAFPGAAIFVTVLAVSLIGDGLNDAMNPKLRER